MADKQSGIYLHDSFIQMGYSVAFIDWKKVIEEKGAKGYNDMLVEAVGELKPDLTLIIKGLEIYPKTITLMREQHKHPIVGWIFDVTLGGTMVKDVPDYVAFTKELDTFYTIDVDGVTELQELGVNAKWLSEGCFLPDHSEPVYNFVQKKKYGADIVFLGSVGGIHPSRDALLESVYDEGFSFKLYGPVLFAEGEDPAWVKDSHTGFLAINDYHS